MTRYLATWPITDPSRPDADLIAEAIADLPNVKPEGWALRDCVWSVEGGHVVLAAEADEERFRCGHPKHGDNIKWKTDGRKKVRRCRTCYAASEAKRYRVVPCAFCGDNSKAGRCRPCANKQRNADYQARLELQRLAAEDELARTEWQPVQWRRKGLIWVAEAGSVEPDSSAA